MKNTNPKGLHNEDKERTAKILKARDSGFTYSEIGQMFQISRQRAFQVVANKKRKTGLRIDGKSLKEYLKI